ncbi:LysR family transcriptional regulator [Variovorax sp. EL159]|uniref:LysR family transcriptional regulator n=1 Tax=Variovorax sp. EL159 TaxID=1566270 RepID=UPI000890EE79|nr:LysR family transcriptional regulator [Variovorax sp. EL159]SCX56948.1 DNA-binding transcriptional regulator, LysR family [Variovorax sp. EL159]
MRHLNLDQLRTLIAIVDLGTFAAAAKALHLAQPTVSLHISELESRLGAPLVIRGKGRILPTASGAVLVEGGRKLLRDTEDLVDATRRRHEGRTGRVRLSASTGVVLDMLTQVLEALEAEHSEIDVEVSILVTSEAIARLAAGTLDIGLVAMPAPVVSGLVVSPWREQPMMAFVPQRWKAPKRATPAWLARKPLIFNEANTSMHQLTVAWFAAAGLAPRPRIELNVDTAVRRLVEAGYGAALLPSQPDADTVPTERVQIVPLMPALTWRLGVAHRPRAMLDGATLNVLNVLAGLGSASASA